MDRSFANPWQKIESPDYFEKVVEVRLTSGEERYQQQVFDTLQVCTYIIS